MPLSEEFRVSFAQMRREAAEIAQILDRAVAPRDLQIGVDGDASDRLQEIADQADEAGSSIEALGDIAITVDGEPALSALGDIATEADRVTSTDTTIHMAVDGGDDTRAELESTSLSVDDLALSTDDLINRFTQTLPAGAQQAVTALASINPALAVTTAAFLGLVVLGDRFKAAQNEIQIATGATGADLEDLAESAQIIIEDVPAGLQDAATVVGILNTFLASTGDELEGIGVAILDASRLLGEDSATNAQNFAQVLNLFAVPAAEGVAQLDLLFAATQRYGLGLGDILAQLEGAGGIFQAVGFDLEQSTTLIGQFNLAGLSAGDATAALTRLIASADESGLSYSETLLDLQNRILGAASEQEAFAIGVEAFGSRAGVSFSQAIRTGIIDLANLDGQLGSTGGLIAQTATDTETAGQSMRETWNQVLTELGPAALSASELILGVVQAGGTLFEFLADSGAIDLVSDALDGLHDLLELLQGDFLRLGDIAIDALDLMLGPLNELIGAIPKVGDPIDGVRDQWEQTKASFAEPIEVDFSTVGRQLDEFERRTPGRPIAESFDNDATNALNRFEAHFAQLIATTSAQALIDLQTEFDAAQFAETEEAYLDAVAGTLVLVESAFGDPFAPTITEEDISSYLDQVLDLQTQVAGFQINLLRLEEELDPEQFRVLTDEILPAVGKESGAVFVQEIVDALDSGNYAVIGEKLNAVIATAELNQTLADEIARAQIAGVPVDIEVNDSELRAIASRFYGINVTADLDSSELTALLAKDYNITIRARIEAQGFDERFFGAGSEPVLADRGGVYNVATLLGGLGVAEAGNPEMVAGKHHRPEDVLSWMDQLDMTRSLEPLLLRRFAAAGVAMPVVHDAPIVHGSDLGPLLARIDELSAEVRSLRAPAELVAAHTGSLSAIAESTEGTLAATRRLGEAKGPAVGRDGWRP